jgi:hypothetical protein
VSKLAGGGYAGDWSRVLDGGMDMDVSFSDLDAS